MTCRVVLAAVVGAAIVASTGTGWRGIVCYLTGMIVVGVQATHLKGVGS